MRMLRSTLKKAPLGAFFIACLFNLPAFALCTLEPGVAVETVQVADIFDGDTVRLVDGRRVRLVGINTPEVAHRGQPAEPLASQAQDQLTRLLEKRPVRLLIGKDSHDHYGRVLGHLFDGDGNNIIAELLSLGAGFQVAIVPNLRFVDCYNRAQNQAREQGLGVWGHDYYQAVATTSPDLKAGYAAIKGRLQSVTLTKKALFVELEGQVSLKVERAAAAYIDAALLDRLTALSRVAKPDSGIMIEARGWLSDRLTWNGDTPDLVRKGQKKRYQMKITHQVSWQIL